MTKITQLSISLDIDYSAFLRVHSDGKIWWRLEDAVKIGAGYFPVCDEQSGCTTLQARDGDTDNNERTLSREFTADVFSGGHPLPQMRNEELYVEAEVFLDWLPRYIAASRNPSLACPGELTRIVKNAQRAWAGLSLEAFEWTSIALALDGWYDRPIGELPKALGARVEREFLSSRWSSLPEGRRRITAREADERNDPALRQERKFWRDLHFCMYTLRSEIDLLTSAPLGLMDEVQRRNKLKALSHELMVWDRQWSSNLSRNHRKMSAGLAVSTPDTDRQYVPYTETMDILSGRHGATAHELASWVYLGPMDNGLSAYRHVTVLKVPAQFNYEDRRLDGNDFDYLTPLTGCWFDRAELDAFTAERRFLTGEELCERWRKEFAVDAHDIISAKFKYSNLKELHPVTVLTQASRPKNLAYPPVEAGLYSRSDVDLVEATLRASDEDLRQGVIVHETSSIPPATANKIYENFRILKGEAANVAWWKDKMKNASRNGLAAARIGPGRRGPNNKSQWRPDLVAAWLLDRQPCDRGFITELSFRAGLVKFPGCKQLSADLIFIAPVVSTIHRFLTR